MIRAAARAPAAAREPMARMAPRVRTACPGESCLRRLPIKGPCDRAYTEAAEGAGGPAGVTEVLWPVAGEDRVREDGQRGEGTAANQQGPQPLLPHRAHKA